MTRVADLQAYLEHFAPLSLAAEWDNVGLLLGDSQTEVTRVMTCLTITPPVVHEAVSRQVSLIVSHHPVLFRGTKKLTTSTSEGKLLLPLIRGNIAVYSPHTAFDNCPGGINDGIARRLGLSAVQPLRTQDSAPKFKLVVFVPPSDLQKVSEAVFATGAGVIGNYEQCSFRITGQGTFFGRDNTNPTLGEKGRLENIEEIRLEIVVPGDRLDAAMQAVRRSHSYEEPAFDIYPLKSTSTSGEGRVGDLPEPMPLKQLVSLVKDSLKASMVQFVGDDNQNIRRVAVACGAAGEFLADARRARADLFLTGEARFHDCLSAEQSGISLILPGHYASERPGVEDLAGQLQREFPALEVWASTQERDPLNPG